MNEKTNEKTNENHTGITPEFANININEEFFNFKTNLFKKLKIFHEQAIELVANKKKVKYHELVKKFENDFTKWMEKTDTFNLDTLFNEKEKTSKDNTHIIKELKDSLDEQNQQKDFDYKHIIIKFKSLEDAKNNFIEYYKMYQFESQKFNKSSIKLALFSGSYLKQIKDYFIKTINSQPNSERKNFSSFIENIKKDNKNIKWTYPYIQFLIKLYNLCDEYPKLQKVTVNLEFLKSNFKTIKTEVEKNINFWKN